MKKKKLLTVKIKQSKYNLGCITQGRIFSKLDILYSYLTNHALQKSRWSCMSLHTLEHWFSTDMNQVKYVILGILQERDQ